MSHKNTIVIVHVERDRGIAEVLHQRLKHFGCNPWCPSIDLQPGHLWDTETLKALRGAQLVVVVVTSNWSTDGSHYPPEQVAVAVKWAESSPRKVIPLVLDDADVTNLPFGLQRVVPLFGRSADLPRVVAPIANLAGKKVYTSSQLAMEGAHLPESGRPDLQLQARLRASNSAADVQNAVTIWRIEHASPRRQPSPASAILPVVETWVLRCIEEHRLDTNLVERTTAQIAALICELGRPTNSFHAQKAVFEVADRVCNACNQRVTGSGRWVFVQEPILNTVAAALLRVAQVGSFVLLVDLKSALTKVFAQISAPMDHIVPIIAPGSPPTGQLAGFFALSLCPPESTTYALKTLKNALLESTAPKDFWRARRIVQSIWDICVRRHAEADNSERTDAQVLQPFPALVTLTQVMKVSQAPPEFRSLICATWVSLSLWLMIDDAEDRELFYSCLSTHLASDPLAEWTVFNACADMARMRHHPSLPSRTPFLAEFVLEVLLSDFGFAPYAIESTLPGLLLAAGKSTTIAKLPRRRSEQRQATNPALAVVFSPAYVVSSHDDHPECRERIEFAYNWIRYLSSRSESRPIIWLEPVSPPDETLRRVHHVGTDRDIHGSRIEDYLDRLNRMPADANAAAQFRLNEQLDVRVDSLEIARLSAGGMVSAVDCVSKSGLGCAWSLGRPPGHLANNSICILNNVAIGAQHALDIGFERVVILDCDLHFGAHTSRVFYERDDVLFVSIHINDPHAETGRINDLGAGRGRGYSLHLCMEEQGIGDKSYSILMQKVVEPAIRTYLRRPPASLGARQLLMVSAGFDGLWCDPLNNGHLTEATFIEIGSTLRRLASEHGCAIVGCVEGGYSLRGVSACLAAMLNEAADCGWDKGSIIQGPPGLGGLPRMPRGTAPPEHIQEAEAHRGIEAFFRSIEALGPDHPMATFRVRGGADK